MASSRTKIMFFREKNTKTKNSILYLRIESLSKKTVLLHLRCIINPKSLYILSPITQIFIFFSFKVNYILDTLVDLLKSNYKSDSIAILRNLCFNTQNHMILLSSGNFLLLKMYSI